MEERKFNALVIDNGIYIFKYNINIHEYFKDLYCVYDGMLHYKMSDHAQRISFIADNSDILSDEEIEYLLKDIDFDNEELYIGLCYRYECSTPILEVPQLAEKINRKYLEQHMHKKNTLDDEDDIYDEFGFDVEY